jgi:hypothetical protein
MGLDRSLFDYLVEGIWREGSKSGKRIMPLSWRSRYVHRRGWCADEKIIGLVNTSYYIRGQYTLIDTLPLCRRHQVLYPPSASTEPEDATTEDPMVTVSADGIVADSVPAPPPPRATGHSTASAPAGPSSEPSAAPTTGQGASKDVTFIPPGQTFEFALKMPTVHFRDSQVELPPTSSFFQVGMQASVEYVLRIKLTRKGWRLNET